MAKIKDKVLNSLKKAWFDTKMTQKRGQMAKMKDKVLNWLKKRPGLTPTSGHQRETSSYCSGGMFLGFHSLIFLKLQKH